MRDMKMQGIKPNVPMAQFVWHSQWSSSDYIKMELFALIVVSDAAMVSCNGLRVSDSQTLPIFLSTHSLFHPVRTWSPCRDTTVVLPMPSASSVSRMRPML